MAFCGNCGKQIDDSANACPFCGTMRAGAAPGGQFGQAVNQAANQFTNQFNNFTAQAKSSGGLTLANILMLAGFGIAFLFSFFAFVKIDLGIYSESLNLFGCGFLGILGFLIILGGIAVVVLDSFVKPMGKIPLILGLVQVVWMIIMFIYVFASLSSVSDWTGDAVSKGIGFWFYIIGSLVVAGGVVMSFIGGKK